MVERIWLSYKVNTTKVFETLASLVNQDRVAIGSLINQDSFQKELYNSIEQKDNKELRFKSLDLLRILGKTDERICKQKLMEKYRFIPLIAELLIYQSDSKDVELRTILIKAANNLIYNNSSAIAMEVGLIKEVIKIGDTLLDTNALLSDDEKELYTICLIFIQTAYQQPSTNKLHKILTDEFGYDRMLKFMEYLGSEEVSKIAVIIL